MQVDVRSNVKEFKKGLTSVQKKQIPFATSRALNLTGVLVLKSLERNADKTFKGGATPSTKRVFKPPRGMRGERHNIRFSTKRDLTTAIYMPPWAANYLKYQIDGGIRKTKGIGTGVPTKNKRLNKYGNITGRRGGLVKTANQFIGEIKGIQGVWERYGPGKKNIKLLIAFEKDPQYKPLFPYYETARKTVDIHFKRKLKLELNRALRNAR